MMSKIDIKFKKSDQSVVVPSKTHEQDAGYDVIADSDGVFDPQGYIEYRTGLFVECPKGYYLEIVPRSSISKKDLILCNSPAIIDSNFRGEILLRFKPQYKIEDIATDGQSLFLHDLNIYKKGDKIAQIILREQKYINWIESTTLSETSRGSGGFGSTGS